MQCTCAATRPSAEHQATSCGGVAGAVTLQQVHRHMVEQHQQMMTLQENGPRAFSEDESVIVRDRLRTFFQGKKVRGCVFRGVWRQREVRGG